MRVDLAEFQAAYITEVDEQLLGAISKLLAIEAAARKGERQPRTVRDLFRAMHTIKGLSAMVGIEPIVGIAHRIESALRVADRSGGTLSLEAIDLILRGVRGIEQCVRAVDKGTPPEPPPALLSALDALEPQDASAPRGAARLTLDPALEQKLDAFERDLLLKGAEEGRRAVRLDYAPSTTRAAQGLNINTVRERVGAVAEIVRVIPVSLPGSTGIAFAMLLLSTRNDEELATAAGVDVSSVTPIVEMETRAREKTRALVPVDEALPEADLPQDEAPRRNLLRVDAARVDDAMDRLGTLLVTRSRLTRAIAKLTAAGSDTRELVQIAGENARQLRDLRSSILQVRMVPLTEILDRMPLMLRALMRSSGKQVRLETEAAGAELDKAVAERIFPAIIHLVRNAVDHGIEPPEVRAQIGKPAEGRIGITCSAQSDTRLELTIEDDGGGVDGAKIAARLGVALPETDVALLDILCQPGFSTRDEATTTSGRGLGMDIVKRIVVDQLGGEVSMHTHLGVGTRFTLQIPLTVAVIDAFVVECAGHRFVVPVSLVEEILEVTPETLIPPPHRGGGDTIVRPAGMIGRREETLPLYALAALLGLRGGAPVERRALVVRRAGEPVGFLVDAVRGQQEAVIRPLVDPLVRVPGISSATDLGEGRPTLVLDLIALSEKSRRGALALPLPLSRPALPAQVSPTPAEGGA
ncbi:MAG TPA: chemotaxis protein CheW [Polyangiaceae bacterium]|jgi:two-component system chemotaxis sensor kinase CheA